MVFWAPKIDSYSLPSTSILIKVTLCFFTTLSMVVVFIFKEPSFDTEDAEEFAEKDNSVSIFHVPFFIMFSE